MNQVTRANSGLRPPSLSLDYKRNDEIGIRMLFLVLWAGKLWIIGLTLLFSVGSAVVALNQPNIYESKSVLLVDS
ncbi:Wzz/FepE/Etk N-terminal domain-containing protein [Vibrio caribbeanicus]|uniref:Wzz/FepE/Etk N-terminal domain-containing protein n=1 Tax=Vibrio caribbeanicus TaxID=701175 RepID=UPI0030DDB9C8